MVYRSIRIDHVRDEQVNKSRSFLRNRELYCSTVSASTITVRLRNSLPFRRAIVKISGYMNEGRVEVFKLGFFGIEKLCWNALVQRLHLLIFRCFFMCEIPSVITRDCDAVEKYLSHRCISIGSHMISHVIAGIHMITHVPKLNWNFHEGTSTTKLARKWQTSMHNTAWRADITKWIMVKTWRHWRAQSGCRVWRARKCKLFQYV